MTEQKQGASGAAKAVSTAAGLLGRLLAFSGLYPSGHRLIDSVIQELLIAMRGLDGGLNLEVHKDRMLSAGEDLPVRDQDRARLHQILNSLAISSLQIRPTVSEADLLQFVTVLLSCRGTVARKSGFSEIDVHGDMPETIVVKHRAYGSSVQAPAETEIEGSLIERLGDLASAAYLDSVSDLVQMVVSRLVERINHDSVEGEPSRAAGRALESVLDLCAHAMRHAIEQMIDEGEELTEIEKLAMRVEQAVALSADKDSVEVLLEVLRLSPDSEHAAPHRLDCDIDPTCELTVQELQERIDDYTSFATPLDASDARGLAEHLTILMRLSTLTAQEDLWRISGPMGELRPDSLGPTEVKVLAAGVVECVVQRDKSAVDLLLPPIANAVRKSPVDELAHFFAPICGSVTDPAGASRLWPHVVAELLISARLDCPAELYKLLRLVEEEQFEKDVKRLARLEASHDCPVTLEWLQGTSSEVRRAVGLLLEQQQGKRIGEQILADLRRKPASWTGFESVYLLSRYDDRARQIVHHLLEAGDRTAQCAPLVELSARIIAQEVPWLPPERRDQPWLPAALMALGDLPTAEAQKALSLVLRRRWWLRPEWPVACRAAARRALEIWKASSGRRQ